MQFQIPPKLSSGDQVAVVATARVVNGEAINSALEVLRSWGLAVWVGDHVFEKHQLFAGTDQQRLHDLQKALDNPAIKAIFCARGGYGTTRILDNIDWAQFKANPKWICGFSDITALLNHVNALNVVSLHGPMPQLFDKGAACGEVDELRKILFNPEGHTITAPAHADNRAGSTTGVLTGGNLSLLVHLLATDTVWETDNKILLIEEVDEYQYAMDRMMVQLKRSGRLKNLAALVVGHLTKIKVGDLAFDHTIEAVIKQHVPDTIPVAFGMPFGHEHPNLTLPLGMEARLQVSTEGTSLSF